MMDNERQTVAIVSVSCTGVHERDCRTSRRQCRLICRLCRSQWFPPQPVCCTRRTTSSNNKYGDNLVSAFANVLPRTRTLASSFDTTSRQSQTLASGWHKSNPHNRRNSQTSKLVVACKPTRGPSSLPKSVSFA